MKLPVLAVLLLSGALLASQEADKRPTVPTLPELGSAAPAFKLNDHEGKLVAVGGEVDHWTVLAFYPKALTPG